MPLIGIPQDASHLQERHRANLWSSVQIIEQVLLWTLRWAYLFAGIDGPFELRQVFGVFVMKCFKRLLFLVSLLTACPTVFAECLVAHVCWMGNECVKEYLISLDHHGDQVKVRVRDDSIVNGKVAKKGPIQNISISCSNQPIEDHNHAVEWTRWMAVCKGQRTQWSSTRDWKKSAAAMTLTTHTCR